MKKTVLLLLLPFVVGMGDAHYFAVKNGNEEYRKDNLDGAAQEYSSALENDPSGVAKYNLANTLFRRKEYDKAASLYAQALTSGDPAISQNALENFGHANFFDGSAKVDQKDKEGAAQSLKNAEAAYKKILFNDPGNAEIKEFLERTLRKLKELDEMKGRDDENKDDNSGENKDKESEKRNNDEKKKSDGKGEKEQPENEQEKEQKAADQEQDDKKEDRQSEKTEEDKQRKVPGKLSKEEAEMILKSLEENEKKVRKEVRNMNVKEKSLEKDW